MFAVSPQNDVVSCGHKHKNKDTIFIVSFFLCLCPQDTTSFDRLRSTSFFAKQKHHSALRTQNDVTPYGVNDVAFSKQCCASHKRCGLTPNDVALRANILAPPPLLCYNILKAVII